MTVYYIINKETKEYDRVIGHSLKQAISKAGMNPEEWDCFKSESWETEIYNTINAYLEKAIAENRPLHGTARELAIDQQIDNKE